MAENLFVKFVTKQEIYAVPDTPFSVPSKADSVTLNRLVKQLLKSDNADVPVDKVEFDFLVHGELLRVSLFESLDARSLSLEETVQIEYVERTPAPQPQDELAHDDWVAGINVSGKYILTGCYDNTVHVWTTKGKHLTAANDHTNCVRGVKWLNRHDPDLGFVSVSHDLTAIIWQWRTAASELEATVVLRGHERGIDSVAVNDEGSRIITGGWDTHLKVWNASLESSREAEPSHKRTRGMITRTPIHTLSGHKETIAGLVWIDSNTVCSASMDHTIKLWDVDMYGIKHEIVGQKAFLGCAWSAMNGALLATSADRHVRMYDPRSTEGSVCKLTFTSHSQWVPAVAWCPNRSDTFMTGGYDHEVKMWDTRSPRAPLYEMAGHTDKVLCVDWSLNNHLVSGGADNSVHVFKDVTATV